MYDYTNPGVSQKGKTKSKPSHKSKNTVPKKKSTWQVKESNLNKYTLLEKTDVPTKESYWFKLETPSLDKITINSPHKKMKPITEKNKAKEIAEIEIVDKDSEGILVEIGTANTEKEKILVSKNNENSTFVEGPEGELIELSFEIIDSKEEHHFNDSSNINVIVENFKKYLPEYKNKLINILNKLLDLGPSISPSKRGQHAKESNIENQNPSSL